MKFKMIHENYNVSELDRSIKFYNEALDLHEVRRKTANDFIIVYLSNEVSDFELELTWLKEPSVWSWTPPSAAGAASARATAMRMPSPASSARRFRSTRKSA